MTQSTSVAISMGIYAYIIYAGVERRLVSSSCRESSEPSFGVRSGVCRAVVEGEVGKRGPKGVL